MIGLFSKALISAAASATTTLRYSRCANIPSPIISPLPFQWLQPPPPHQQSQPASSPSLISIRHATKKAGGSTSNGRDSAGRRLGIKVWPGTLAKAGSIIVRQRGKKFLVGENVGMGNDHTIFALIPGRVRMERSEKNRKRNFVHVIADEP